MSKRTFLLTVTTALVLSACNKDKASPAESIAHLQAAQDLFAKKDYPHALVEAQNAIKANPKSGDAHYMAAQIQEALGQGKAAFEEYARAAAPEANNIAAQLKVVEILMGANQLDMALGRINGTLGSRPNDPDALALRALIEQRQGNSEKSRVDAQTALARDPGQAMANAVLAADALRDKNADRALAAIDQGLKKHPGDMALTQLKAAAFLLQGQKDQAIGIYEGLTKSDPRAVQIRGALAELYASSGDVDHGEQTLRDGVKAAPDSREMRVGLVLYLARHRSQGAAEKELRAAIATTPNDSGFDLLLAEQLVQLQRPDDAVAVLKAAIDRVPEGPARSAVRIGLARLDIGRGQDADARKLLDDAITAKADNDDALLLRADLMIQFDDTAHAIPDLLAVAGRRPRSPAPLSLLAQAYLKQGDTTNAIEALKKVVYFEPKNLPAAGQLATVYQQQNKPDLAKQTIDDFVKRNPNALDGRVADVRLDLQRKDWVGAQKDIDQMRTVPNATRAVGLLGAELNEAKGAPAAAAVTYKNMIDPTDPSKIDREAVAGYVRAASAAKQTDDAIAFVTGLTSNATGDSAAFLDLVLATLYRASGQDDKAADAYQASILAAPKLPGGYVQMSTTALLKKQPDQAIATLNAGLAAGAPPEPLLMARAAIEEQTDKKDAAIGTYEQVLKVNPRSVVAANNYASLCADSKPDDKALLTEARKPIQRFANATNPALLDTLAWLDYRLGDFQSAKDLLARAKADTSANPQLRFHYGAVLIALGDKVAGRTLVKAVVDQPFPGHAEAERLLTE